MAHHVLRAETLVVGVTLGTPRLTVTRPEPLAAEKSWRAWLWLQFAAFSAAFSQVAGKDAEHAALQAVKALWHWLDGHFH